ncbi:guanine nucleotide exchange factor DBS-like isoform X3 [Clavelina lepadiformis]|uniref:guanine nucleotide exchange factor DBS-like isoform X3 n=1 Tax=Clavelina lepadiformis TaxID=159417 RepID=UPI004041E9F0
MMEVSIRGENQQFCKCEGSKMEINGLLETEDNAEFLPEENGNNTQNENYDVSYLKTRRNAIDFSPVHIASDKINVEMDDDCDFVNNNQMTSHSVNDVSSEDILPTDNSPSCTVCFTKPSNDVKNIDTLDNRRLSCCCSMSLSQPIKLLHQTRNRRYGYTDAVCDASTHVQQQNHPHGLFSSSVWVMSDFLSKLEANRTALYESVAFPNFTSSSRSITAKRLLSQLECCFAYMHGGRDLCDAPIICFPHYPTLREVSDEDFQDVILYLASVTSASAADVGFVLLIDRRKDKWSSLRGILIRLASFFPGFLRMVLVLKPLGFLQGTISDIGFRWQKEDFRMKVPVMMISNSEELSSCIHSNQLTEEFGGDYQYNHQTWIKNRVLMEDYTTHASAVCKSLELYGTQLAETELPNDVLSTEALIKSQQSFTATHKGQIDELRNEAVELKNNISLPSNSGETLDRFHEAESLQSVLSLVEEMDIALERFWSKHEERLNQCLQLRQFEQHYKEAQLALEVFSQYLDGQNDNVGTTISWVESLIKEHLSMQDKFKECERKCEGVASSGDLLIENSHYAVDCIAPKCEELRQVSSNLSLAMEKRKEQLKENLVALTHIQEVNSWCDKGMTLLAGQILEKTQTFEGAHKALSELESFFGTKNDRLSNMKELNSPDLDEVVQDANHRLNDVTHLFEKRRASLKKVTTRHGERPVQLVEPSKQNKPTAATRGRSTSNENKRNSFTSLSNSPAKGRKSTPPPSKFVHSSSNADHQSKLRHVMKELLETERAYVEELRSIVEGYGKPIDDDQFSELVPESLKGKKNVLLGNMESIYQFHGDIFLSDLEECKETPANVGGCFIKRKDNFNIYCEYCQNSARSDHLRSLIGEKHPFFIECQQRLGHPLPLSAYLLKPVQRITKYQLLLQQMLKFSSTHKKELQAAVQSMLDVLKLVNDSMHQTAIVGYQSELESLGRLLMQGPFSVQVEHKKTRVKNLTRSRFSKPLHRHLFLFEKEILFCKQQAGDTTLISDANSASGNGNQCSSANNKGQIYLFKHSLKMGAAGITETMKNDPCKFEIWYQGREEVYTIVAPSAAVKQDWVHEIKKVLALQPKSETTPPAPHRANEKHGAKAKRSQSLTRKTKPATAHPEKQANKTEKSNLKKSKSTLQRSASMGKGKDKIFKRKNTEISTKSMKKNMIVEESKVKSKSLPRTLDPPPCSTSDTEDTSDNSRTSSGCRFVVMKDRSEVTDESEAILHVGDIVEILEAGKEGWVKVRLDDSGFEGWAPTSYMASMSETSSFESVSSYLST